MEEFRDQIENILKTQREHGESIADLTREQSSLGDQMHRLIQTNDHENAKLDQIVRWQAGCTKALWILLTPLLGGAGIAMVWAFVKAMQAGWIK